MAELARRLLSCLTILIITTSIAVCETNHEYLQQLIEDADENSKKLQHATDLIMDLPKVLTEPCEQVQPAQKYIGCYIDKHARALSARMPDNDQNTAQSCIQQCLIAGYKYAATEYSIECFCGNTFNDYGIGTECTYTCPGNTDEMCGGFWHLSLYETGRFIGCYMDKEDRILSKSMYRSHFNSGDVCKNKCKNTGYRYAGTEGLECFCGHTFKDYPKETGCNAWCSGNTNERCGGQWRISLYDTSVNGFCDDPVGFCPTSWVCENAVNGFFCKKNP